MDNTSSATFAFSDRGLEAALDAIGEAGFAQAELWGAEPHIGTPSVREQARVRAILDGHSVRARTMHAPTGRYTLGATDEDWRHECIAVFKEYVRLAGSLGLTEIVIHPIPAHDWVPDIDDPKLPPRIREAVQRSLDDLMPTIEKSGTRVTLENLPRLNGMPLRTMKELRAVVDGYPDKALGLILDTGHAAVLGLDPVDEVHAAGERLCGTHIHDIDVRTQVPVPPWATVGRVDHHSPTLGNLDWAAMRKAFTEIGYTGPWTSGATMPSHGESREELAREVTDWMASWV